MNKIMSVNIIGKQKCQCPCCSGESSHRKVEACLFGNTAMEVDIGSHLMLLLQNSLLVISSLFIEESSHPLGNITDQNVSIVNQDQVL